jgi:hypothetical protein
MNIFYIIIIFILSITLNNVKSNENEPKVIPLHNTHNHRKVKMNQYNIDNNNNIKKKPNIIVILADDLGYSDTSVYPFDGAGILTPNLEKMALNGAIMTNFHTAAATCTPSRYKSLPFYPIYLSNISI